MQQVTRKKIFIDSMKILLLYCILSLSSLVFCELNFSARQNGASVAHRFGLIEQYHCFG